MRSMPIVFDCDLSDLFRHYTRLSFHQRSPCVCLPSCQVHARVREGWRRQFRVTQAKREQKLNEIQLPINNQLIQFD